MAEKLVIGISGASGAPIAIALLKELRRSGIGTHLVISRGGELTIDQETGYGLEEVKRLAGTVYDNQDLGASLASGSFKTLGMAVVPCSMKTLAGIVSGYSDSLLLRAADVTLKERRPLVLMPRECPLSTLHLRNLTAVSELGAVVVPPVPAWYDHPRTMEDVNRQIAARIVRMLPLGRQLPWEWRGLS